MTMPANSKARTAARKSRKGDEVAGGLVFLGIVGFIAYSIFAPSDEGKDKLSEKLSKERTAAREACMQAVRRRSLNPRSIDFSIFSIKLQHLDPGWLVTGPVSMKNDFGHRIHFFYQCNVERGVVQKVRLARQ